MSSSLIKTIIEVVAPAIGNKIYDGAVGSAGFLVEAFEYLKNSKSLTTKDAETLQKKTFYGKEKKSLAYIIGIMIPGVFKARALQSVNIDYSNISRC